ncbi:TIGR00297 family protein [Methanoregula sp.]|uniref:TIGR00297 family protein n=1 Tax=Methanoregula sp. TaxID=2052170 RepID=UPI003C776E9F
MQRQRGLGFASAFVGGAILIGPYMKPAWLMGLVVIFFALLLWRFFDTKYLTYTMCVLAALYGISLLPFFVFSTTLAMLVLGELVFQTGADDLNTYLYYVISTAWAGVLVMAYLHEAAILTVIFGIIAAVLLKVILLKYEDSLVIEGVGTAMTMWLIQELNYQADLQMVVAAVIVGFTFAYFAFRSKTADLSGLFSSALVGIVLLVFAGPRWFMIMLVFFIVGSAATKYKFEYKKRIGVEQGQSGARGYRNVFANGIVATAAAVLFGVFQQPIFIVMYVGSVATAAADTLASEIGVTGGIPYMITTLKKVPIGTNGGVTLVGESVALLGGLVVSLAAFFLGVITLPMVLVCTLAGFVGTNIDSVVGATLENRGFLGNAGTNLLATIGGGLFSIALFILLKL